MLHPHDDIADTRFFFGVQLVQRAADHHLNDPFDGQVLDAALAGVLAVTQHDDPFGDLEDLFETVGDEDHADPLFL